MMRKYIVFTVLLNLLLATNIAFAHSGEHAVSSFPEAIAHIVSEPFHLLMILAALVAGVLVFRIWKKAR